jgi:hypothetical protein
MTTTIDSTHLHYIIDHVFLPPKLPQKDTCSVVKDHALAKVTYDLANEFLAFLSAHDSATWNPIVKMLDAVRVFYQSTNLQEDQIAISINDMRDGGEFAKQSMSFFVHRCL